MKATDLMIGDWVMSKVKLTDTELEYIKIEDGKTIDEFCRMFKPIPLTAEILENNFPKSHDLDYWVDGDFPIIGYSIPCITDGHRPYVEVSIYDPARVNEFEMYFHYVHELQHALRLCGFDKEIEL